MMKKRLLFVISALETGGAEKSLVNLLNQLSYEKYDVDLLLFKRQGAFLKQVPKCVNILETPSDLYCLYNSPVKGNGILLAIRQVIIRVTGSIYKKIYYKNELYPGMQARWNLFYKNSLKKLPKTYDVAISYMHGESMYYVAEKVCAKKKITWVHNDYKATKLNPKKDYPYFQQFDRVVTISDECVRIWKESFPDLKDRIVNIPNITSAILTQKMADAFYPDEYVSNRNKILISIGRLHLQKGFDFAIDAAKILKDRGLKFTWYVIGQGDLKDALTEQIKMCSVEDCFVLLGVRENPYPYIKNADILVQSSRYEGKSVVLDEAKILNKPCIVTNYPTVNDQISDKKEGVVVDLSAEAIANGIEKILSDHTLYEGIEKYLSEHEYGNVDEIKKYYKIFDE